MLTDLPADPSATPAPPRYTLLQRAVAWPFRPDSPRYLRLVRSTRMLIRANAILAAVDAVAILAWSYILGGSSGMDRLAVALLAAGFLCFLIDYGIEHWAPTRRPTPPGGRACQ